MKLETTVEFSEHFPPIFEIYLQKGKVYRKQFTDNVETFFNKKKRNFYIAGQPGVGKTHTVKEIAKKYPNVYLLEISGSQLSPWAAKKAIAAAKRHCDLNGMQLLVYVDDLNKIFKANSEFLDMFKQMMHKNDPSLEHNGTVTPQMRNDCNDIEREAIEHYLSLDPIGAGFSVDLTGVKFLFTMNTPLPSIQEVNAEKLNSDAYIKLNNRHAIRDRVKYEDLVMDKETYWGWIAAVVWNEDVCEDATHEQRAEMLRYLWEKWDHVPQHSIRYVDEDLWMDMDDYPQDYRLHWDRGLV